MAHHGTRPRPALAALALLLAVGAPAGAATERWYQVELLVFRYRTPVAADGEQWLPPARAPEFAEALSLLEAVPDFEDEPQEAPVPPGEGVSGAASPAGAPGAEDGTVAPRRPMAFMRVPEAELGLPDVAGRLAGAGNIELVDHLAWRQPSFGNRGARSVYLHLTRAPPPGAEPAPGEGTPVHDPAARVALPVHEVLGTVRLREARHLHLDLDLLKRGGEYPAVRIEHTRKMRVDELHYFDHPLFGVLARLTPYEFEVPDPGDREAAPAGETGPGVDAGAEAPGGGPED